MRPARIREKEMNWYLKVWKQYADFSGRARRKEYWTFTLFNAMIIFVLMFVMIAGERANSKAFADKITMDFMDGKAVEVVAYNYIYLKIGMALLGCYALSIFIPSVAVCVRRLHDIGKSGWYYFIGLIPLVGAIILLVWYCTDSQAGENKWGVNPKEDELFAKTVLE